MNITNLEIAQATIEIFGGFICLMLLIIIIMNGYGRKSWNLLKSMLFLTSLLFFSEASAYIFRGNTDWFSIFMTRSSNFCVFVLNVALMSVFVHYIYTLLEEKGIIAGKVYKNIVRICVLANLFIIVSNLFTRWMYYFDESNYYHRNVLWYVYTVLNIVCIMMTCAMSIRYHKAIRKTTFAAILFYVFVPVIAIILQAFIYGISITNIGIFLALIVMLFAYLLEWSRVEERGKKQRKFMEIVVLFIIMTVSMSASIISCVVSIGRISDKNGESNSQLVANMVSSGIENEFLRPIVVSETMSEDYSLKEYMKKSGEDSPESIEEEIAAYLDSIRSGFGYKMVFAVCDASKAYYTYDGISKFVDMEQDEHDIWYKLFLEEGKNYDLDVDTDEANQWELSVFVNAEISDENGNFLGVCGIGVKMEEVQNILKRYEEDYNVKIDLIDAEGLIQVDTDEKCIEQKYLDNSYLKNVDSDKFYYEEGAKVIRMTKYMESLDWYLVVEYQNQDKYNAIEVTITSIIIFVIGLVMMGIVFSVISIRERKAQKELIEKRKISITDDMTGLFNRRAFEEDGIKMSENNSITKMTMIMMDVNGLKSVNDTYGHMAGDELIISVGKCIQTSMGEYGKIYRTGGDEFVAVLDCTRNQLDDMLQTFEHMTANWKWTYSHEISISKGIVVCEEYPNLDFDGIKELADRLMYKDKDEYYRRTGKERRKI